MRFIGLDTETTGTDREKDQVIEICLVAVDTKKPRREWPVYHKLVSHDRYEGGVYAIALNARIFAMLRDHSIGKDTEIPVIHADNLGSDLKNFLIRAGYTVSQKHGKITIYAAGKNPHGFDIPMLLNQNQHIGDYIQFGHRSMDPAILFWDHETDEVPPGLEVCKERAGLPNIVTHNAKEDTFDVIDLIFIGKGIQEIG